MQSRNQSLDVLRGIAVLMVIISHYHRCEIFVAGGMGVDLFFVLSGFLISGLLFTEVRERDSLSVGRFLLRRGFKIYPAFYFFICLTAVAFPGLRRSFLTEAFFLQGYFPVPDGAATIWEHLWSLAVEEHFYLVLPLMLMLLNARRALHWIPGIAALLIVGCFALRISAAIHGANLSSVKFQSHLRMDALFAGVALGYFYHFQRERFMASSRWWMAALGSAFLLPGILGSGTPTSMAFCSIASCNLIGFSFIVAWAVTRRIESPMLEIIGRHSYSIYLWHLLVTALFNIQPLNLIWYFADVAASIVLGILMAFIVEIPLLRMRDKFFPSQAVVLTPNSAAFLTPATAVYDTNP